MAPIGSLNFFLYIIVFKRTTYPGTATNILWEINKYFKWRVTILILKHKIKYSSSLSILGIITTESTPVDATGEKQPETNAQEPASVTPLEQAVLLIYSLMFYLTKTVSLIYIFSR